MRRIDRLLLKVQEPKKTEEMQVGVCIIEQNGDKWKAIINLSDGLPYPNGNNEQIMLETDTVEDAIAAIKELDLVHAPTGHRTKKVESLIIVDNLI